MILVYFISDRIKQMSFAKSRIAVDYQGVEDLIWVDILSTLDLFIILIELIEFTECIHPVVGGAQCHRIADLTAVCEQLILLAAGVLILEGEKETSCDALRLADSFKHLNLVKLQVLAFFTLFSCITTNIFIW